MDITEKQQKFLDACYTILGQVERVFADDRVIVEYFNPYYKTGLRITRKSIKDRERPQLRESQTVISIKPDEDAPCLFHEDFKVIYDHVIALANYIKEFEGPLYLGYHEEHQLDLNQGERVRIKKGTQLRSMDPQKEGFYEAGKTYTIEIDHFLCGQTIWSGDERETINPKVCWAGSGNYWVEADINDVERITD